METTGRPLFCALTLVEARAEEFSVQRKEVTIVSMNYLQEILTRLSERGVRFIICGGVAVVLQGVERMTLDLDLSLDMQPDNLSLFLDTLRELHMTPRAPVPAETILDGELRQLLVREKDAVVFSFLDPDNPYKQVDVMLTDAGDYGRLVHEAETVRIGGFPVRVVSREGLIRMKEAMEQPREKDLMDIRALRKMVEEDRDA